MGYLRRWRRCSCRALAVLTFGARAAAQQAPVDDYGLLPLQTGTILSLWSGRTYEPGEYALALGLQARAVTLSTASEGEGSKLHGSASTVELLATLGLLPRLDLSAAMAIERIELRAPEDTGSETERESRTAFRDVRVIPRLRLMSLGDDGGLALLLPALLSVAGDSSDSGDGVRLEPRVAASGPIGPLLLNVNGGYRIHLAEESVGAGNENFLTGGLGAAIRVADAWSLLSEVSLRWAPDDRSVTDSNGLASEARLAARFMSTGWAAQFGAGAGLLGAALDPDWRLLASVSVSPFHADPVAPILEPSPASADPDDEYLSSAPDWRPPPVEESTAPTPHRDPTNGGQSHVVSTPAADGVIDVIHATAPTPGDAGRDPHDRAADGPLRTDRQVPEVFHFAPRSTRLDAQQRAGLAPVVLKMTNTPTYMHLLVEGHSDNRGSRALNWALSRSRALHVRYQLILAGVEWQRIGIRSYGSTRPVTPNINDASRAENRRVEFRLVQSSQFKRSERLARQARERRITDGPEHPARRAARNRSLAGSGITPPVETPQIP
jgi:outer membrane protein OmpA-like peptidoglycan-associated protein